MKERPILFSAPMVRALLAGTKTQTRRAVRLPLKDRDFGCELAGNEIGAAEAARLCPYGVPGDRLWARETCSGEELPSGLDGVRYVADDAFRAIADTQAASINWLKLHTYRGHAGTPIGPKVPGIHMPRWASRISLEVTGVRVERLQEISEADARAEGLQWDKHAGWGTWDADGNMRCGGSHDPVEAYRCLWTNINGNGSWDANPWVWIVEVRRLP